MLRKDKDNNKKSFFVTSFLERDFDDGCTELKKNNESIFSVRQSWTKF